MKGLYLFSWPLFMFFIVGPAFAFANVADAGMYLAGRSIAEFYSYSWIPEFMVPVLTVPAMILAKLIPSSLSLIPVLFKMFLGKAGVYLFIFFCALVPAPYAREIRAKIRAEEELKKEMAAQ